LAQNAHAKVSPVFASNDSDVLFQHVSTINDNAIQRVAKGVDEDEKKTVHGRE